MRGVYQSGLVWLGAVAIALSLTGCLSVPRTQKLYSGYEADALPRPVLGEPMVAPSVQALVDHIRCEITVSYYDHERLWEKDSEVLTDFRTDPSDPDDKEQSPQHRLEKARADAKSKYKKHYNTIDEQYLRYINDEKLKASLKDSSPAYEKYHSWEREIKLWQELTHSNFQAAVEFTVLVTDNEGVNLPLSATQPLDYMGGKLSKSALLASASKGGQPSDNYGMTLAVSGQSTAYQDNYFDLNYIVDLKKLIGDAERNHFYTRCVNKDKGRGNIFHDPLLGSLRLDETLGAGLAGLEEASLYASQSNIGADNAHGAQVQGGLKGAGSGGNNTFSSRVDFNLTWTGALNPSINTLWFKAGSSSGGGGGGGGGGGSGGGGGGGSGGGGSGGGGGSNVLSGGQQRLNTMLATFSPVCKPAPVVFTWTHADKETTPPASAEGPSNPTILDRKAGLNQALTSKESKVAEMGAIPEASKIATQDFNTPGSTVSEHISASVMANAVATEQKVDKTLIAGGLTLGHPPYKEGHPETLNDPFSDTIFMDVRSDKELNLNGQGILKFDGSVWICRISKCKSPADVKVLSGNFVGYYDDDKLKLEATLTDALTGASVGMLKLPELDRNTQPKNVSLEAPEFWEAGAPNPQEPDKPQEYLWSTLPLCTPELLAAARDSVSEHNQALRYSNTRGVVP